MEIFSLHNNSSLISGIANAKLSLSFSAKESNQRKLSAAPASLNVSALTSGVVAEPADAEFCGERWVVLLPNKNVIVRPLLWV